MEPSGRNRWQLVADARSAKFVQSSRNRCRRLRPLAAGTPWAVPWREAWPTRDRGPPAEERQRAARPRRPRGVYRVVESRPHPCLGRDRVWLSRSPKASTSTPWTLRGRRQRQPPSTRATERRAKQEESGSPLTDSNRRPPPYHASDCHRLQPRGSIRAPYSGRHEDDPQRRRAGHDRLDRERPLRGYWVRLRVVRA